jgi:hypothetical protein
VSDIIGPPTSVLALAGGLAKAGKTKDSRRAMLKNVARLSFFIDHLLITLLVKTNLYNGG